jgi:hypothetical protein
VLGRRRLVLLARCDVACVLTANGQLAVGGTRARTLLSGAPRMLHAQAATLVALKLTTRGARLLARALSHGRRRLVASLTISAASPVGTPSGMPTMLRRSYRVRR